VSPGISRKSQDYDQLDDSLAGSTGLLWVCRGCKAVITEMRGHDRWHLKFGDQDAAQDKQVRELAKRVTKLGQEVTAMVVKMGRVKR
jgi:hypothetical protein